MKCPHCEKPFENWTEAAISEAEALLRDIDEHLGDEPHPADGGSWHTLELRDRIKRFLTHG